MTTLGTLLHEYGKSHQNPINKQIHNVCVPVIMWSLLGILYSVPHPDFMGSLTFTHVLIGFALGFYVRFKSSRVFVAALLMILPFWLLIAFKPSYLLEISIVTFFLAWIGQFVGHKIEGKKPSFFEDVFFLLIGPLWVVETFLRKWDKSLLA